MGHHAHQLLHLRVHLAFLYVAHSLGVLDLDERLRHREVGSEVPPLATKLISSLALHPLTLLLPGK